MLLAYLSILPQSCEKFLEVSEPTNQISQTTVFKDKKLALSALSDVYTNLRANGMLKGDLYGLIICWVAILTKLHHIPIKR
jgi:hypothetical protein